jgi:hypothetical protein
MVADTASGSRVLSIRDDHIIVVAAAVSGRTIRTFACTEATFNAVAFSPDAQQVIAVAYGSADAVMREVASG